MNLAQLKKGREKKIQELTATFSEMLENKIQIFHCFFGAAQFSGLGK